VRSSTVFVDTGADARHERIDARTYMHRLFRDACSFVERVILSTRSTNVIATTTLSTMLRDAGAEARRQFADAHEPRDFSDARSFIKQVISPTMRADTEAET